MLRSIRAKSVAVFLVAGIFAALLLATVPAALHADTIIKKNGHELVGKIVEEEDDRVLIEVVSSGISARLWVPRKEIARIEKGETPLEQFEARRSALAPHDLDGHRALITWARRAGLSREAKRLEKELPRITILERKHDHPRRWCRTCDADGVEMCEPCAGEGEIRPQCEACDGAGENACKVCANKEDGRVRCRRCAGGGEVERFDPAKGKKITERCRDCRGSGLRECPRCDGKGASECAKCRGKALDATPCETCAGKPRRTCRTCDGKGLQPTAVSEAQLAREKAGVAEPKRPKDAGTSDRKPRARDPKPIEPKPPVPNPFDD